MVFAFTLIVLHSKRLDFKINFISAQISSDWISDAAAGPQWKFTLQQSRGI